MIIGINNGFYFKKKGGEIGVSVAIKKLERYNKKIVKSGNIYEIYEYEKTIESGFKKDTQGRFKSAEEDEKKKNRAKVQQRAKRDLRRIINANAGMWSDKDGKPFTSKFLTLTFEENITDVKNANIEFDYFRRRINKYLGYKIKYCCVVEFQKRGAVHYHLVIFNLPFMPGPLIAKIWQRGFIKINKIDEVDNIGAYVSKYMGKDLEKDKLIGEKSYFTSRGLYKSEEIKEKGAIERLQENLKNYERFEFEFENDYTGKIKYTQINTNKKIILQPD